MRKIQFICNHVSAILRGILGEKADLGKIIGRGSSNDSKKS